MVVSTSKSNSELPKKNTSNLTSGGQHQQPHSAEPTKHRGSLASGCRQQQPHSVEPAKHTGSLARGGQHLPVVVSNECPAELNVVGGALPLSPHPGLPCFDDVQQQF